MKKKDARVKKTDKKITWVRMRQDLRIGKQPVPALIYLSEKEIEDALVLKIIPNNAVEFNTYLRLTDGRVLQVSSPDVDFFTSGKTKTRKDR
jgi:hypothetical protein